MKVIGTAEATVVIADYFDLICDTDYAFDESEILRRLNANAVDAEPVRHGKWIPHEDEDGEHYGDKCSECGEWYVMPYGKTNFCPHCGADMRSKE